MACSAKSRSCCLETSQTEAVQNSVCAYTPICIAADVCVCVFACIYLCIIYIFIYLYMCVYVNNEYIYIYTFIFTYYYIYIHIICIIHIISMYIYIYAFIIIIFYIHITSIHIYIYIYGSPPPIDPCFLASTTYSGRIPSASHDKSSLWVQGYITSFSHTRGRAPLNVHAAPKFLGHLG